ncbi:decarboxylase [Streptomyces sp. NPDC005963]|uniref:maleate cis-trans isomerase family protein n=1 Tax=Streptomyces sp. NPDC005963 TaxID=3156721 RepID=UPI00340B6CF8
MTTVGLLIPGHSAEEDYPRLEVLLDSDIRMPSVHTGTAEPSEENIAELRLGGAESVLWASTRGSFGRGWEGAHQQIRELARAGGLPASSTSFAFVHAVRKLGAARVAVAATYPQDDTDRFTEFLRAAGVEVVAAHAGGATAAEVAGWGEAEVLALARAGDDPRADVVLLPDTALHTVAHLPELEETLGKPVLTATQVTVWEGLRLADRRTWALKVGRLFAQDGRESDA